MTELRMVCFIREILRDIRRKLYPILKKLKIIVVF